MAYPISSALKEAFLNENRQVARLTVTPTSGSAITITEADIVSGTFVIDRSNTTGDTIEVGGCIASELSFSLYNEEGQFSSFKFAGASINVEIGVVDNTDTVIGYIPMGRYIIDTVPKVRNVIAISALDRMVKFDKVVPISSWLTWSVGKTVAQYVSRICTLCGVTLSSTIAHYNNAQYVIPTSPSDTGMTYRQLLLWCCQMMGKNGYMDWNGNLRIDSTPIHVTGNEATSIVGEAIVGIAIAGYPKTDTSGLGTTTTDISEAERFASDYEDYTVEVTGVTYSDDDGNDYIYGTEAYVIDLTSNPLIQDPNYLLPYIGVNIMGISYTPFSATTIPYPFLYPGDWVAYMVNGTAYYGILTNLTFRLNGHNTLESVGESEQRNGYANVGSAAQAKHYTQVENKKLEKRISLVADRIDLVADDVNILGEQIQLKVDSNGVVNAINLSEEGIRIDASKLNINGVISANGNFKVNTDGTIEATGATISGDIVATSLTLATGVTVAANKVSGLANVATSGSASDVSGLANVATSGSASDVSGLAAVATSGSYTSLSNRPDLTVYVQKDGTIGSTPASGVTGFKVSSAGLLQASNAIIYGSLYSSTGTIGGFTLAANKFSANASIVQTATSADAEAIRSIVMDGTTPTMAQIEAYDFDGDGVVTSADYIHARNIVSGMEDGVVSGTIAINTTDPWRTLVLRKTNGNLSSWIGLNGMYAPNVGAATVNTDKINAKSATFGNVAQRTGRVQYLAEDDGGSESNLILRTLSNVGALTYSVISYF